MYLKKQARIVRRRFGEDHLLLSVTFGFLNQPKYPTIIRVVAYSAHAHWLGQERGAILCVHIFDLEENGGRACVRQDDIRTQDLMTNGFPESYFASGSARPASRAPQTSTKVMTVPIALY